VDKAVEQWTRVLNTGFESVAKRALKVIREEGAFTPTRRRRLGMGMED